MPFTIGEPENDIPDGTYVAVLEQVEITSSKFGEMRKWHWIADVAGTATPVSGVTSTNTGPTSKAYAWLKAILGRELTVGETYPDPVGMKAVLTIGHNEKGFPTILDVATYVDPQQVIPGVPR